MTSLLGALVPSKDEAPAASTTAAKQEGRMMRAVQWQGARSVAVGEVPAPKVTDPKVRRPPDALLPPAGASLQYNLVPPARLGLHPGPTTPHTSPRTSAHAAPRCGAPPRAALRAAPQDAIIRITPTGLCGSDLHLYLGQLPGMKKEDILGHEPLGIGGCHWAQVRGRGA